MYLRTDLLKRDCADSMDFSLLQANGLVSFSDLRGDVSKSTDPLSLLLPFGIETLLEMVIERRKMWLQVPFGWMAVVVAICPFHLFSVQ